MELPTESCELNTKCPDCGEQFSLSNDDSAPKVLSCCHALCTKCCRVSAKSGNLITCSVCKATTSFDIFKGVQSLLDHFPLLNELKQMEIEDCKAGAILCDNCDVSTRANWKCLQCDSGCASLCDACKEQHNALKALRTHEVISMAEFAERSLHSVPTTCSVHDEPIEVYCQDCMTTMCCSCAVYQHQSHTRFQFSEGADIEKEDLQRHIDSVSEVVSRCCDEVERVRGVRDTLSSQNETLNEAISTSFTELHDLLHAR
jgi:hypothetical protein